MQTDAGAIRDALYRQAFGPVRWVEVVQALRARGADAMWSNAARARCWPAWSSASMPRRMVLTLFDPATLAEAKETARMSDDRYQVALVTGASRGIGRAIAPHAGRRRASR